jgi:hypothetical protein
LLLLAGLLLAGLLQSATLLLLTWLLLPAALLTWLLTGGLVLLARILVGIAHSGPPLLKSQQITRRSDVGCLRAAVPWGSFCVSGLSHLRLPEPAAKTILYKPFG